MTTVLAVTPAHRSLLRHRDFRRLWIGQTTSRFGSTISTVALPLIAVATLDATIVQVALLQAATWLPWLLIGLPAGAWVDRLPRRPVLIICDVLSLLLFLSVPVAAWLGALTIGHLLTVALLGGTAAVFFETAYQVYLPSLLPADRLAEGNARMQGTEAAAQVAGPGAAGLIAQLAGATAGLLVDAATFAVSAVCLLIMRHREPPRAAAGTTSARRTMRREIAAGLSFVVHDPYLRVLAVFGAAANLALMGYQAILIVFLVRENGVGPGAIGGVVAVMSLGGVLGAAIATRVARRFGTAHGLLLCELGAAPFALLIPLTGPGPRLAPVMVGGLIVGTGVTVGNILKNSFRQAYPPRELLGRVVASMQLVNYGTMPMGALLGGALGATIGLRPTMWVMAAGLVLSTAILLVGPLRHDRDLPTHRGA